MNAVHAELCLRIVTSDELSSHAKAVGLCMVELAERGGLEIERFRVGHIDAPEAFEPIGQVCALTIDEVRSAWFELATWQEERGEAA